MFHESPEPRIDLSLTWQSIRGDLEDHSTSHHAHNDSFHIAWDGHESFAVSDGEAGLGQADTELDQVWNIDFTRLI